MSEFEKLLKKSKVYRQLLEMKRIEIKNGESFAIYGRNAITIWVPRDLSPEARAGIVIFELYGYFIKSINHIKHLVTSYLRSTRHEKELIWRAALEYLGKGKKEELEKRYDYGYWRLFKISSSDTLQKSFRSYPL